MKRPWAWAVDAEGDDVVMGSAASFLVSDVTFKGPCRSELPELVPDHLLGDEHRDMASAVVNGNGVADHHRQDG